MFNTSGKRFDLSAYQIEELKSPFYGRCYMICSSPKQMDNRDKIRIPLIKIGDINGLFE